MIDAGEDVLDAKPPICPEDGKGPCPSRTVNPGCAGVRRTVSTTPVNVSIRANVSVASPRGRGS